MGLNAKPLIEQNSSVFERRSKIAAFDFVHVSVQKSWNWLDRFLWHNIIVEVILKKPSCSGLQKVIWIKPSCRHNIDTLVLFWSKLKSKLYSSNGPFSIKQNVWFKISFCIAIDSQLTHFFSIPDTPIYFNILVFSIPNLVNAKFKLIN